MKLSEKKLDATLAISESMGYQKFDNKLKFKLLWIAFKNLFENQGLYLITSIRAEFGTYGIVASNWMNIGEGWKSVSVTFDGKTARGYIDGELVSCGKEISNESDS